VSDAWGYLQGTVGDAWDRLGGSGDAWERLYGDTGDAWTRLTTSIGVSVYIDTVLLQAITSDFDCIIDHETAVLAEMLASHMAIYGYDELITGKGSIITLGFINGREVTIFPPKPPWTHFTDADAASYELDNDRTIQLLESVGIPLNPDVVTGPIFANIQMGATIYPVAIYGDSIYLSGVGAYTRPLRMDVYAEVHHEIDMPAISSEASTVAMSPYAWLRNDLDVISGESALYGATVDTDCAVPIQTISIESYGFMCKVIGVWTGT